MEESYLVELLNPYFQFLNNITCISTRIFIYFFTHTYFKKIQIILLKLIYQTDPSFFFFFSPNHIPLHWLVGHLLSLDSIFFTAGVWELRRTYSTQKINLTLWLMCCRENAYCVLWHILYEHGTGIYCNIWIFFTWQILYAKRQALKSWLQWVTFISHKLLHTIIHTLH